MFYFLVLNELRNIDYVLRILKKVPPAL